MAKVLLLSLAVLALALGVAVALPSSERSHGGALQADVDVEVDDDAAVAALLESGALGEVDADSAVTVEAMTEADVSAVTAADAEEMAAFRAVTEPKAGETASQFEAATVMVKAECSGKCKTLSGISRMAGLGFTQGMECITPCEECADERVKLGTSAGDGSLRFNVLSLRCYATQTEQNRDAWRRYVLPTLSGADVPKPIAESTANARNGAIVTLDQCHSTCAKLHASGDFFGRKKKGCVNNCEKCLDQSEQLGHVHYIPATERCHTYRFEVVAPQVDALTSQAAYNPKCAQDLSFPAVASNMEQAWEPDVSVYASDKSRRLDTMAVRAGLRNWLQTQYKHVITTDDLCPGDIIVRHSYHDKVDVKVGKLHRIEFQGSKVILDKVKPAPASKASAYCVHGLMATGYGTVGESVHPGVVLDDVPNTDMFVYRPRNRAFALNAAKHMNWMTKQKIAYSTLSVVKASLVSVLESNPEFDPNDRGSVPFSGLSKARDVAQAIREQKASKVPDAMMCIEAVVNACHASAFGTVALIPQFSAPVVLEKYIHSHPEAFVFVGALKHDVNQFYNPIGKLE